jgi:hypothetical protein
VLLSELMKVSSFNNFYDNNQEFMQIPTLAEHLITLCRQKGIQPTELVRSVDIDRVFGHQIFAGRRNPTRDYLLKLALGLRLNIEECQRALSIAKVSRLYMRIPRDALILYCLSNKYTYQKTQEALFDQGMAILTEADKQENGK